MYEIKKLDVISVAKIQTFIVVVGYVVWAAIFTVITLSSSSYTRRYFFELDLDNFTILAVLIGLGASAIIGFASGAISALIYNLIASWIGGIKMDIELDQEEDNEK